LTVEERNGTEVLLEQWGHIDERNGTDALLAADGAHR
jgi:hypothetical protein